MTAAGRPAPAPIAELLAGRRLPAVDGGKHDRGTLLLVGGAETCPGAALLAGTAALRAGCGRVQLVVHPTVAGAVAVAFPEAWVCGWAPGRPLPEVVGERLGRAAAVVVGPGLDGDAAEAARTVAEAVPTDVPLVLDAMALPATWDVAGDRHVVVAPNPGEAADLLGEDRDGVDEAEAATALADRLGRAVAVRGAVTVVADASGGRWCQPSGAPGLGTAGSGDVATGVLGGLLARGADALTALGWAVAVHAEAGALAAADVAPVGFLAGDVADRVPRALDRLGGG